MPLANSETSAAGPDGNFAVTRIHTDADAYLGSQGIRGGIALRVPATGFRASVSQAWLDGMFVCHGEANAPVTYTGAVIGVHAFVFALRPAAPRRLGGREVPFGTLYHPRPNELLTGSSPSGQPWPFGTVAMPYETLERVAGRFAGRPIAPPRDAVAFECAPELGRLIGLVGDVARLSATVPEQIVAAAPARALRGALMDALLACLARGEGVADRAAVRRRQQVIARFEEVARWQAEAGLSLAELCAATGVAERTLHLACHETYGMGPVQVLRERRLAASHAALRLASPAETTVAAVAMRFGFWELGRFAAAYRARYGQAPSATLRASPR